MTHETTVRRHLNDWLNGEKLAPANGGSDSHLSEEKTAELVTYLTNNLLPTTQAIIALFPFETQQSNLLAKPG